MKYFYPILIFNLVTFASVAQIKDTIFHDTKQNNIWQKGNLSELT